MLQKRTALITGASSGLGADFAQLFAKDGHNLVLLARNEQKLTQLAQQIESDFGVRASVMVKDLGNQADVDSILPELQALNIHIDYLVNNAGLGEYGPFHESDWPKLRQLMDVNILALSQLTHQLVQPMVAKGYGKILHVASTAAFQPGPLMAAYYASKAFVLSLGEAMHHELKDTGVTVTVLCPGPTETNFFNAAAMDLSRLTKSPMMQSSKEVVSFGYRKMMAGKMTVIPGLMNKLGTFLIPFAPRKWPLVVVSWMQGKMH